MRRPACRCILAFLLLACASVVLGQGSDFDEQQLKALNLPTDAAGLLDFFRRRTPGEDDVRVLKALVQDLDNPKHAVREKATRELLLRGPLALPVLREALQGSTETVRRAEECIRKIESSLGNDATAVAARALAQRNPPEAVEVLLNYVVTVEDGWLQEEVLVALGRVGVHDAKADPVLLKALSDRAVAKRAAAAYVIGRRGGMDYRPQLRTLLEDAGELVRERAAEGLAGKGAGERVRDARQADEELLRASGKGVLEPSLLQFLRKRTLDEKDQQRLQQLVRDLGSAHYATRARASRQLLEEGTPALSYLKAAMNDADAEVARRAQACLELIERGPGPALPAAAVRLLSRSAKDASPTEAIRVLMGYAPFADDDDVEDAVVTSLVLLSLRQSRLEPGLVDALTDPLPARRGAAAYVLGHVGMPEHLPGIKRLLEDPSPQVRLRAAQGLLAARDRAALPPLIALLGELPGSLLWRAEEPLYRLAGDRSPGETAAGTTGDGRQKAVRAWQTWWQNHGAQADLARLTENESYLGLITVAEYDSALGQPGGQVWEGSRDGRPRWKLSGIMGAMDAHVLPNGRVLVAENSSNRITERDLHGNIKWSYTVQPGNPICCQRLPNGNTFIALYNQVLEVTPDRKEIYRHTPGPQFYIFSAYKARNGHIIAMTAQGQVLELEALTGKQVRPPLKLSANGNWCGIELLPNGNYLVATLNDGAVREVTPTGNHVWSANYPGAFRATRLPNGNVLVASMTTRKIAELDRRGVARWERTCEGRPWSVHYR